MRQAKLSELIHNSAKYPDLEECSVEIHFRTIIDQASVVINKSLALVYSVLFMHVAWS